jgi:quercetin dioxygenase-like cupin family protein
MTTFAEFEAAAKAQGADEVLEREYAPNALLETHTHPFAARALVVRGEFWLTCGSEVRHLRPGDRFEVAFGTPHAERYGPEGATFWVARHNGPAAPSPAR